MFPWKKIEKKYQQIIDSINVDNLLVLSDAVEGSLIICRGYSEILSPVSVQNLFFFHNVLGFHFEEL